MRFVNAHDYDWLWWENLPEVELSNPVGFDEFDHGRSTSPRHGRDGKGDSVKLRSKMDLLWSMGPIVTEIFYRRRTC